MRVKALNKRQVNLYFYVQQTSLAVYPKRYITNMSRDLLHRRQYITLWLWCVLVTMGRVLVSVTDIHVKPLSNIDILYCIMLHYIISYCIMLCYIVSYVYIISYCIIKAIPLQALAGS
jgi:hypothetical protein